MRFCFFLNVQLLFTERPVVKLPPPALKHTKDLRFNGLSGREEQEAGLSLIIHLLTTYLIKMPQKYIMPNVLFPKEAVNILFLEEQITFYSSGMQGKKYPFRLTREKNGRNYLT